jgi:putative ABC transport system permease protein
LIRERVSALFMFGFGGFGLALAALGVYGVVAFGAARRTREFGIRRALGAEWRDIVKLVLAGNLTLVAIGALIGTITALVGNRLLAHWLSDMGTIDPLPLISAVAMSLTVAAVACLAPAWRAARANPTTSLRDE